MKSHENFLSNKTLGSTSKTNFVNTYNTNKSKQIPFENFREYETL